VQITLRVMNLFCRNGHVSLINGCFTKKSIVAWLYKCSKENETFFSSEAQLGSFQLIACGGNNANHDLRHYRAAFYFAVNRLN